MTKYKYVKYDTGNGYIRQGIEPHPDGEWVKAADIEPVLKAIRELLLTYPHYATCATNRDLLDGGPGECSCRKAEAQRLLKEIEERGGA